MAFFIGFKPFALACTITFASVSSLRAQVEDVEPHFLTQATQDLFETSIATLITGPRASYRVIENCLEAEPENIYCLYTKYFLDKRLNPNRLTALEDVKFLLWRNKIFDQPRENRALLLISHFESKLGSKNYALARQALDQLSQEYPDYPDLLIMKRNLNFLSAEVPPGETDRSFNVTKALEVYQKRCRQLDSMTIRKYLFDVDLCNRRELYDGNE